MELNVDEWALSQTCRAGPEMFGQREGAILDEQLGAEARAPCFLMVVSRGVREQRDLPGAGKTSLHSPAWGRAA